MRYAYILTDIVVLILAFYIAYSLRSAYGVIQSIEFYSPLVGASFAVFLFSKSLFRLYHKRAPSSLSYFIDYIKAFLLWGVLVVAFSFFTKTDYSRLVVILYFFVAAILAYAAQIILGFTSRSTNSRIGDDELTSTVEKIVETARIAPDTLSVLEGVRAHNDAKLYFRILKRFFDVIISIPFIVLFFITYPVVAFFIQYDSKGPALIKQKRIGKNGKKFTMYKYRTMKEDADMYAYAPRREEDTRVTRVGAWLRKYSIDELPQFMNVLRGDMGIVGPRPEMEFIVEKYEPWQCMRLAVRPGITGLWQVVGRKDLPLEENIEYDIYYVLHQSFLLDIAIMLKTIPRLFFSRGAY